MSETPNVPAAPYRRRPWRKFLFAGTFFALGLSTGLAAGRFLPAGSVAGQDLVSTQNQANQSLKALHDKLDQIDRLNQSITSLTNQVNRLDQTLSLSNDLSSLAVPSPDTSVLGTASAGLYPDASISGKAIGGSDAL